MRRFGLLLVTVLVLGACASSPSGQTTGTNSTTAPTETTTTTTTAPTETSMPDDSDPDTTSTSTPSSAPIDMVETAIADLATRLGVDPRRIRLIERRSVTWPDGSLGCPEPDESYPTAQVDGYLVMISHEDRVFSYHAGVDASPFLCASDEKDGGRRFVPPPGFDT